MTKELSEWISPGYSVRMESAGFVNAARMA